MKDKQRINAQILLHNIVRKQTNDERGITPHILLCDNNSPLHALLRNKPSMLDMLDICKNPTRRSADFKRAKNIVLFKPFD